MSGSVTAISVELEAAKRQILELAESLAKACGRNAALEDRLASTRSVLSDTSDRLREEIARADEATEEANLIATHSTTLIEADRVLRQRVRQLEGFLYLCRGHFAAQGQSSWAGEAGRVLRGEKA